MTISPSDPVLQNEAFAELVIVVLAAIIVAWACVDWMRGKW